jgi:hypothetical protein
LIGVPETGSVTMDAWKSLQPKGLLSTGKEIFQGEREGEGTTLLLGYPEEPISQTNKSTRRLLQLANVSNNTLVLRPAPSGWADAGQSSSECQLCKLSWHRASELWCLCGWIFELMLRIIGLLGLGGFGRLNLIGVADQHNGVRLHRIGRSVG